MRKRLRNAKPSKTNFRWIYRRELPTNRFLLAAICYLFASDRLPISDQIEELRGLRGTLGLPGTVAPFRAWRGSRDLVARSPKFHDSAVTHLHDCTFSLTHTSHRQNA